MLSDVLAFDLRVFDPGAPLFATWKNPSDQTLGYDVVLSPSDPGWRGQAPNGANGAYFNADNMGSGAIGTKTVKFSVRRTGGVCRSGLRIRSFVQGKRCAGWAAFPLTEIFVRAIRLLLTHGFSCRERLTDVYGTQLAPGFAVYDTWSFHYENNGVNEDGYWSDGTKWYGYDPTTAAWKSKAPAEAWRSAIDQGTDGLDNDGQLGVDDAHERETVPPYDKPLRGVQVIIRAYERDSRAIRQVRVNQHFMPE